MQHIIYIHIHIEPTTPDPVLPKMLTISDCSPPKQDPLQNKATLDIILQQSETLPLCQDLRTNTNSTML